MPLISKGIGIRSKRFALTMKSTLFLFLDVEFNPNDICPDAGLNHTVISFIARRGRYNEY